MGSLVNLAKYDRLILTIKGNPEPRLAQEGLVGVFVAGGT